ncbi:16S rRNA (guanine(966)-N(2))-methyltransferase R smD [Desulfonema ishimotonii]|uniref:16S rRNA (Guanine(966)-N(2))-methyltransferase R smD n=1 Tax=Desulfonema ishimotonii TaxID=45657 RepID=A0A401G115_9BACT|nr:16S rRNA (guanine(966)-N(2))-methyltransferase R smD [Desulfonema ishimotonii]
MRIIGGKFRGRKLHPIRGMTIRPTSDRLRETLFNILSDRVRDAVVLDIFAGTGALGLEALSRGAGSAVFIDKYGGALTAIARNIGACSAEAQTRVIRWDVSKNLGCIRSHQPPFDLVFMDPPYDRNLIMPALTRLGGAGALAPAALIVVEHTPAEPVPEDLPGFSLADQRKYGKTLVSFLKYDMNAVSKTEG